MATNNGSAEIVNMEDARARRRAADLNPDEFETAGAHLAAVREASGFSIAEVAERTHIKPAFIEAIETMDAARMPSRPFAVGFVKVYAEALGLPGEAIARRFKEDAGFSARAEVAPERFEAAKPAAPAPERPQMSLVAVFLVLLFILWCAWQITRPRETVTPFNMQGPSNEAARPQGAGTGADTDGDMGQPAGFIDSGAPAAPNLVEASLAESVDPVYPRRCEASAADAERVTVAFNVTADGLVTGARVATSTNSCFNDAALNAARRWRFEPRTVDGAARPAYDLRYVFRFDRPA